MTKVVFFICVIYQICVNIALITLVNADQGARNFIDNLGVDTMIKSPKLVFKTGEQIKSLRKNLGLNQSEFWSRISVSQSGGSRYESGGNIPKSVQYLLQLTFGTEKQVSDLITWLHRPTREATRASAQVRSNAPKIERGQVIASAAAAL
ncbi:MAG: helix-turn-helix domain-containing protein [Bacteroidota bacterium]